MNLEYKEKYLKYKTKYFYLKNQMAGASNRSSARQQRLAQLRNQGRKMSEEQELTKKKYII